MLAGNTLKKENKETPGAAVLWYLRVMTMSLNLEIIPM